MTMTTTTAYNTIPICPVCGRPVLGPTVFGRGGETYHVACAQPPRTMQLPPGGEPSTETQTVVPRADTCRTCRFWQPDGMYGNGQCRKNPPVIVGKTHDSGRWPATAPEGWCGEFKPGAP